ncbi:MAG: hypothetical protein WBO34_12235 [Gammaproteobacteria bacterium]
MKDQTASEFHAAFKGRFENVLRWEELDNLRQTLEAHADAGWYIYTVGEEPPAVPASGDQVQRFLNEIMALLREEHDEEYCGIVYADSVQQPSFVKFFNPDNLGVSCGFSDNPPLPGWILSRIAPRDLEAAAQQTGSQLRWWQRLLGN